MEKQKNEGLRALQESVYFSQGDQVARRSVFLMWQNYAIIGLLLMMFFGGSVNSRLNAENERLFRKNRELAETKEATLGFILNDRKKLERATTINSLRVNGFPFRDWQPGVAEKLIEMALSARHYNALVWVADQPEWFSILSEDTVKTVEDVISNKYDGHDLISKNDSFRN